MHDTTVPKLKTEHRKYAVPHLKIWKSLPNISGSFSEMKLPWSLLLLTSHKFPKNESKVMQKGPTCHNACSLQDYYVIIMLKIVPHATQFRYYREQKAS